MVKYVIIALFKIRIIQFHNRFKDNIVKEKNQLNLSLKIIFTIWFTIFVVKWFGCWRENWNLSIFILYFHYLIMHYSTKLYHNRINYSRSIMLLNLRHHVHISIYKWNMITKLNACYMIHRHRLLYRKLRHYEIISIYAWTAYSLTHQKAWRTRTEIRQYRMKQYK